MADLRVTKKYPNSSGWEDRHNRAIDCPNTTEFSIVMLLKSWDAYARTHQLRYNSKIGEDGFLGPLWEDIGKSLRGMLNGELGRLDGGTCDAFILDTMNENGVDISLL